MNSEGKSGYNEYEILDQPGSGTYYYRLYSLQYNGVAKVSDIRSISVKEFFGSQTEFKFYPNPAKDLVMLSGDYESVSILNISGKFIQKITGDRINVSELTPGFYTLKVSNSNQTERLHKLIVQLDCKGLKKKRSPVIGLLSLPR